MKLSCSRMLIAALACFLISAQARAALEDNLVGYWALDGDFTDAVGISDGTFVGTAGASFSGGKFGQGIDLDGVDQYVDVGNHNILNAQASTGGTGNVSVSAWFTVDAFDKTWQALLSKGEGSAWRIARRDVENQIAYAGGTQDMPNIADSGPDVSTGGPHHVVAITEGGVSTRLWVDGVLVADSSVMSATVDPVAGAPTTDRGTNNVFIGENVDSPGRSWNGLIDDVAIWDRVITEDEIADIWNGGSGASVGSLLDNPNYGFSPGDTNGDGVDMDDYLAIRDNLGTSVGGGAGGRAAGDVTGDGFVDIRDFGEWKDNAPAALAASVNIPEPSTIAMALLGLAAAARIRRRT